MQLICEAYSLLKGVVGLSNQEIRDVFDEWNKGDLDSYLIEITRDIFGKKEESNPDQYVVDNILDVAGQKVTHTHTHKHRIHNNLVVHLLTLLFFFLCCVVIRVLENGLLLPLLTWVCH